MTETTDVGRPRVVSLIASAAEILHALGAGDGQVGRSHECDCPETVLEIHVLTKTKFKAEGTAREIDEREKSLLKDGLAVYEVDSAGLHR